MRGQKGFTLTELLIAITISSIVIGVLFSATLDFYGKLAQAETTTNMALESQAALSQMVEDIKLSTSLGTTNQISDPNVPTSGWTTSDPNNVFIINSPATDSNHDIIYDASTGYPYRNEYIYFLNDGKWYKRILKNTAAPGNTAVTTCPPEQATATCPVDKIFSDKVVNISFIFYDDNNATTAVATDARSVFLTIDMSKRVFGKNLTLTNSTRVTFRNQ